MSVPDPMNILACLAAFAAILLPGAGILAWRTGRRWSWIEALATAFGLGLAVIALAALAGRIAGVRFTLPVVLTLEAGFAVVGIIGFLRRRRSILPPAVDRWEILAVSVLLGLRFVQAAALALPAWVDSVHHTFLVRVFLERGGIPADLHPWIPGPFYYHYGFHASAAFFSAVSGLAPDQTVLVFGQLLNAAAAFAAYRLSMALRPDRRQALLVLALVGFFSQMPAFYLSWGRYTLLAGMILLPLAMAEAIEFTMRAPRPSAAARLALLTGGLLLTHYLAAILLAVFLILIGLYALARRKLRARFPGLAASAGTGLGLALPWLVPMLRASTVGAGVEVVASQAAADAAYFANYPAYLWALLGPLRNYILLGAGLLAALAAIFRRGPLRVFAVWGLILAVQTLPWGFRFEPFRPDHLAIVLFLPAAILAADGFMRLAESAGRLLPALRPRYFFGGVALAACAVGLWQTRAIVNPRTVFADADDRAAATWVTANTPADAVFLINTEYWQSGLYRGTDGGWWLLPLAGRRTLLPPMLYSFADRSFIDRTNAVAAEVSGLKGCSQSFWVLVRDQVVTHIYIKEGVGSLQPQDMTCPGVEEIFRIGKVRIYRIDPGVFSGILPAITDSILAFKTTS